MDRSALEATIDAAAGPMRDALWLHHVRVEVHYGPLTGCAASCDLSLPYRLASLTFDPAQIVDDADALRLLRHELLHVVHGEFDHAGNVALALGGIRDDTPAATAFDHAWRLAEERTVNHMENVLDGLGWTPAALAAGAPRAVDDE